MANTKLTEFSEKDTSNTSQTGGGVNLPAEFRASLAVKLSVAGERETCCCFLFVSLQPRSVMVLLARYFTRCLRLTCISRFHSQLLQGNGSPARPRVLGRGHRLCHLRGGGQAAQQRVAHTVDSGRRRWGGKHRPVPHAKHNQTPRFYSMLVLCVAPELMTKLLLEEMGELQEGDQDIHGNSCGKTDGQFGICQFPSIQPSDPGRKIL